MTPTLILPPRYTADSINLWRVAISQGWDVTRFPSWRVPDDFEPEEPVLFAEPLFNEAVAQRLGLRIIAPPEDFLPRLPREYTSREVRLMTAAEARSLAGPVFLKPPNRKLFQARVYASGEGLPELPADDLVLASEPVVREAEFRFFVRDRRLRSWSPYWLNGALARRGEEWLIDHDAASRTRAFVDRLLADGSIDLPPAVVIDAGVIRDVGPAVVEANEASGSGLYGCDPVEVLDVLRAGVVGT